MDTVQPMQNSEDWISAYVNMGQITEPDPTFELFMHSDSGIFFDSREKPNSFEENWVFPYFNMDQNQSPFKEAEFTHEPPIDSNFDSLLNSQEMSPADRLDQADIGNDEQQRSSLCPCRKGSVATENMAKETSSRTSAFSFSCAGPTELHTIETLLCEEYQTSSSDATTLELAEGRGTEPRAMQSRHSTETCTNQTSKLESMQCGSDISCKSSIDNQFDMKKKTSDPVHDAEGLFTGCAKNQISGSSDPIIIDTNSGEAIIDDVDDAPMLENGSTDCSESGSESGSCLSIVTSVVVGLGI